MQFGKSSVFTWLLDWAVNSDIESERKVAQRKDQIKGKVKLIISSGDKDDQEGEIKMEFWDKDDQGNKILDLSLQSALWHWVRYQQEVLKEAHPDFLWRQFI